MRAHLLPAAGLLLTTLIAPAVVRADCQPASSVEEALASAPVAFVGTVVAAQAGAPGATLRVDEVWVGTVPETVVVRGMGDGVFMEDDRHWTMGATYLVIPYLEGGVLRVHICTATTEWRDDLAALRPPDAHAPEDAASGPDVPGAILAVVAVAAVLTIVAGYAFRRRAS